jgi:hypothetical protein
MLPYADHPAVAAFAARNALNLTDAGLQRGLICARNLPPEEADRQMQSLHVDLRSLARDCRLLARRWAMRLRRSLQRIRPRDAEAALVMRFLAEGGDPDACALPATYRAAPGRNGAIRG